MSEDDLDQPTTDTMPTIEDAFALLGNKIRAEIIKMFGEEYIQENSAPVLRFSEVRSRMDGDIDPSRLHYHLRKLVGHFIEKTDNAYRLGPQGALFFVFVRAGFFSQQNMAVADKQEGHMSVNVEFDCHYCRTSVDATVNGGTVRVQCPTCEHLYDSLEPLSGVFEGEDDMGQLSHFSKWANFIHLGWARGICPICGYLLGAEFLEPDEIPLSRQSKRDKVRVFRPCNHCGLSYYLSVGEALLADPDLLSFCYDHGVDVVSTSVWELEFAATDKHVTVRSTNPWEVALQVTYDGDTLELVVNGDLTVIERNRSGVSDESSPSLVSGVQRSGRPLESIESADMVFLPAKADCLQYVRDRRWPEGVVCPHCRSRDVIKKGNTKKGAQRYKCHGCDTIFNDLTGTIFAKHRFSLPEMFHIAWEMDETKPIQIARQLNRSYQSVLEFVHELEAARNEELQSCPQAALNPTGST